MKLKKNSANKLYKIAYKFIRFWCKNNQLDLKINDYSIAFIMFFSCFVKQTDKYSKKQLYEYYFANKSYYDHFLIVFKQNMNTCLIENKDLSTNCDKLQDSWILTNLNTYTKTLNLNLLCFKIRNLKPIIFLYHDLLKQNYEEVNEEAFKDMIDALLVYYLVFNLKYKKVIVEQYQKEELVKLQLFLIKTYTYKMQLIFATKFNDIFVMCNGILAC